MSKNRIPNQTVIGRKPGLGRTLHRLLESQRVTAVIKVELTGASAEAWRTLQDLASPLKLSPEQVLSLLLEGAFHRVSQVLEAELATRNTSDS